MKHIRLFRYIDMIYREGSVRRAAEKLHLTPSALDRRLTDLEDDLGAAIFERHSKGMRLSAAGEVFLSYMRRHISETGRLRSEIERLKGLQRGHVSLAVSPALVSGFIPRTISLFQKRFPGVSFSVSVIGHEKAIHAILAFEIDLAIIIAPPNHPDLMDLIIANQSFVALMDRNHPLATKSTLRLSECLEFPIIIPTFGFTTRKIIDAALRGHATHTHIAAETNSYEIMSGLICDTSNIGFTLETSAPTGNEFMSVLSRPVDFRDIIPAPLICAQLKGRTLSIAASWFANFLSEEWALQYDKQLP